MKSDGDQLVDGDQLSFIAVNDPEFHKLFMTLCPTYTFIDRSNGKFNDNMTFKREYSALVSAAWEIDKAYDQWLSSIDSTNEVNPLVKLGLENDSSYDASQSAIEERKKLLARILQLDKDNAFRKRLIGNVDSHSVDLEEAALLL